MISFDESLERLNSIEIKPTNIVKKPLMDGYAIKYKDIKLDKLPIIYKFQNSEYKIPIYEKDYKEEVKNRVYFL